MFGDGYVGTGQDAARASMLSKAREALFSRSEQEKKRMKDETAAHRLKAQEDKFSSTNSCSEVLLVHQTVGLCSKEDYAKKRLALEEGGSSNCAGDAEDDVAHCTENTLSKKKKKKKGKEPAGSLSFAMDEEDGCADGDEIITKKPKKNPNVQSLEVQKEPAAEPEAKIDSSVSPVETVALPSGYTCIRQGLAPGTLELNLEVMASNSVAKSKVTGIAAHHISLAIKGTDRNGEANNNLCGFLRSVFGGSSISCDIIRGERAPIKQVRLSGVESADVAHHRLLMAYKFYK